MLYRNQGRYEQAEPLYQRALAIREKALGPDHPDVATSLNNLARLYQPPGPVRAGRAALPARPGHPRESAGARPPRRRHQPQQPGACSTSHQGRYAQAEPLYQRALAIREKALGPDHPDAAASLNNLAVLYDNQGRYEQAEPLYHRALAIREKVLGPDHPATAASLNNLAVLYRKQGRHGQAEPLYQRALAIREKALAKAAKP